MNNVPKSPERDVVLDWVKGALVILMVVYHGLGYSGFVPLSYRYLAFIRPSFIFIAGFLLTSSYLRRYDVQDWRLARRLETRGLKLILLFTFLNLVLLLARSAPHKFSFQPIQQFAENWFIIYFTPSAITVSFTILLSIGYLLVLAPLLLLLQSWSARLVPAITTSLIALVCYLDWRDISNDHLEMLGAGFLGFAMGVISRERYQRLACLWIALIPMYLAYRSFSLAFGEPYLVRLIGACVSLLVLYGLAHELSGQSFLYRQVLLFGRYSLFGYIFQLAVLQVLQHVTMSLDSVATAILMMVTTLIVTWAATKLLDWLRKVAHVIDASYRSVFA